MDDINDAADVDKKVSKKFFFPFMSIFYSFFFVHNFNAPHSSVQYSKVSDNLTPLLTVHKKATKTNTKV